MFCKNLHHGNISYCDEINVSPIFLFMFTVSHNEKYPKNACFTTLLLRWCVAKTNVNTSEFIISANFDNYTVVEILL